MKKIYLLLLTIGTMMEFANAQLLLNTQFINPCGGDEHNEFIVAKTGTVSVNIAKLSFGSYNPSSNSNGVGGTAVVDYNYWWAGTDVVASPYPTFSAFPGETCNNSIGISCYGFKYPSVAADATDISNLIDSLNTVAGCNVFLPVPFDDKIPAGSNVIVFLGAGFRGTGALCGFNNLSNNLNFSNHCSGGVPATTYYAVFGKGSGSGPNCTNTTSGYFSNSSRRISVIRVFNGGSNLDSNSYTTSRQDYTPGTPPSAGNAGLIVPNPAGGTSWINNQGCVPPASVILPIRFEYFRGNLRDKKVTLNWKSSFEQDIRIFVIEKSLNGRQFSTLKTLQPANISGTTYSSDDINLVNGYNFYRLKVINLDGTIDYSPILKFNYTKGAGSNWYIYSNPVEGNATVVYQSAKAKKITIQVSDVAGKLISTRSYQVVNGTNNLEVSAYGLSPAMYILKIVNDEKIETATFIKK